MSNSNPGAETKAIAEPYAFALMTWPAVVGLMTAGTLLWTDWTHFALAGWLAVMHLAAYGGGRGIGFGNVMAFNSAVVALACYGHPSPWIVACLPALLIGLHAGQRAGLGAAPPDRPREGK